ncbi:MAG TPA: tRNA-binding protein [Nitrososphaerales archaeon]|nr:tRNA-binding protein [Nitrososphaerales archaeon]
MSISIDDFSKVELKVGRITSIEDIPQARNPMYKLMIDFGDGVTKQCVGGIKPFYTPEQLVGRQVIAVMNLLPKSVAGVVSEVMMLAAFDEVSVSLLLPDKEMPLGTRVG